MNHVSSQLDQGQYVEEHRFLRKLDLAKSAGVQWLRSPGITIERILGSQFGDADYVARHQRDRGFRQLLIIDSLPRDYRRSSGELREAGQHCARHFSRFGIRDFQLGNEPNNVSSTSPVDYATFAKWVSQGIRDHNPSARVVLGGLGHGGGTEKDSITWMREVHRLSKDDIDVLAFHIYRGVRGDQYLRDLLEATAEGNKPVWITEHGVAGWHLEKEQEIWRSHREFFKHPRVQKLFWYAFGDYEQRMRRYNLLDIWADSELQPVFHTTQSYNAYKEMTAHHE